MALHQADRRKVDRDEVFLEYTNSICPVCKRVLDAEVNVRDNRVILRKRCPQHGPLEALVYSDGPSCTCRSSATTTRARCRSSSEAT